MRNHGDKDVPSPIEIWGSLAVEVSVSKLLFMGQNINGYSERPSKANKKNMRILLKKEDKKFFIWLDEEFYQDFCRHTWRVNSWGHLITNFIQDGKKKTISLHRLVMGFPPNQCVDHKNGNKLDNRKSNLRICSVAQNNINVAPKKGKKYKGVFAFRGKWQSVVRKDGKQFYLGTFSSERDAARAYNEKAKELFGEFAWLNKV